MAQASETRARLLAAARRVFAELGYTKARVEDVVNRAGVGHGTFYAYFPNKQAAMAERTLFLLATRKEPLDRDQTIEVLADLWYHVLYKGA